MVISANERARTGGLSPPSPASASSSSSNLEAFLAATTPAVPSRTLRKSCFQDPSSLWHSDKNDEVEFFALEDLWDQYAEMSAYGLQVPIRLEGGRTVAQYYVPYLSALQLYTNKSRTSSRCEESEIDSCSDDSSSEKLSLSSSEKLSLSWDSSSDDSGNDICGATAATASKSFGELTVHFVDWSSPYERVPLADKIYELAQEHPCLLTLKSVEVSPASWMSIAWYPIYHIPMSYPRVACKDISACFLTYHTISSLFQDGGAGDETAERKTESRGVITLSPFGLSTYRMQGSLWIGKSPSGAARLEMLQSAAESWLKQLGVHHPDYSFFATRSG